MAELPYKRILLKVSGEVLAGDQSFGIEPKFLAGLAAQIAEANRAGVEIAIVIGAGNIFRGMQVAAEGGDRVTADQMGMLGTIINSLALGDALKKLDVPVRVFSTVFMPAIADRFHAGEAQEALSEGKVVICGGGTGNPFFTTDTASALKAIELKCDVMLKGTKVDGVYSADPFLDPTATRFTSVSHDEVLSKDLKVMDMAAFALARDNGLQILVYSLEADGGLMGVLDGRVVSTKVG